MMVMAGLIVGIGLVYAGWIISSGLLGFMNDHADGEDKGRLGIVVGSVSRSLTYSDKSSRASDGLE